MIVRIIIFIASVLAFVAVSVVLSRAAECPPGIKTIWSFDPPDDVPKITTHHVRARRKAHVRTVKVRDISQRPAGSTPAADNLKPWQLRLFREYQIWKETNPATD